jgi:hypothetical protein
VALLLWLAGTAITLGRRRTVGERAAA